VRKGKYEGANEEEGEASTTFPANGRALRDWEGGVLPGPLSFFFFSYLMACPDERASFTIV